MYRVENEKLFNCTCKFIKRIVPIVKAEFDKDTYRPSYREVPSFSTNSNGFPSIYVSKVFNNDPCPSECFGKEEYKLTLNNYDEYNDYVECIESIEEAIQYFVVDDRVDKKFMDFSIQYWILEILNAYMYEYDGPFNTERIKKLYVKKESIFYNSNFSVDIVIPILFTKFEVDKFEIANGIEITEMSREFQLGRMLNSSYVPAVPDIVMSGATHSLRLRNYEVKIDNQFTLSNITSKKRNFPIEEINLIFALLRLISDGDTGYSQLIVVSNGWANKLDRNFPSMIGLSVREYPEYFEDYYWLSEGFPEISKEQLQVLKRYYENYSKSEDRKLRIAIKRLRSCLMRNHEEDSLLDAIIGIETLLSDNGRGSVTYKLSLKLAALFNHFKVYDDIITVQKNINKIYDYRSELVHGGKKIREKRVIKVSENIEVPVVELAIEYLKKLLMILLENPEFLDSKMIDKKLLLRV